MKNKINNQNGFTLMELLVSVSLFVVVISIASSVFINSSRSQKKVALLQKVQNNARLAIGTMTERIKSTSIDYSFAGYGGGVPRPADDLALVDQDGNTTLFSVKVDAIDPGICPSAISSPCLAISTDNGNSWNSLTGSGVKVEGLKFFIRPENDPFTPIGNNFNNNTQPNVTILLGLQNDEVNPEFQNLTFYQTTVVSRIFKR